MAVGTADRAKIIGEFRLHETDTASPQVQVALLTARLEYLNEHFKANRKDHHSRTGLMRLVSQRRRLLDYLHKHDNAGYQSLIQKLGIRK
jgi:small subunit ribosomal protein S15